MVSCASCVCKRVFEVISRSVVSVCVHCYRESSRIRQPPQVVANTLGIKESVKGKWWRPEDLGIVDYSQQSSQQSLNTSAGVIDSLLSAGGGGAGAARGGGVGGGAGGAGASHNAGTAGGAMPKSLYNDNDVLVLTDDIVPLVPGLLDGIKDMVAGKNMLFTGRLFW